MKKNIRDCRACNHRPLIRDHGAGQTITISKTRFQKISRGLCTTEALVHSHPHLKIRVSTRDYSDTCTWILSIGHIHPMPGAYEQVVEHDEVCEPNSTSRYAY